MNADRQELIDKFKRETENRWQLSEHRWNHDESIPSGFWITARTGKRKGDTATVTFIATYTHKNDPIAERKIDYFRKVAEKIVDDHNASLPVNA